MTTNIRAIILIIVFTVTPAFAQTDAIGDGVAELPIFDAHMHYKQPAWEAYPVATVIELMDRNGVAMAAVSSTPDDGTIRLRDYAPNRIVPLLRPYHGDAGSGNWTKAPGMEAYIRERLAAYDHDGIGEFHVHNIDPADRPLLAAIAAMAKERGIPVHIHSGAAPVRLFYELEPELTVIWAHAGMSEPPETVGEMLDSYATLHADLSYREREILGGGDRDQALVVVPLRIDPGVRSDHQAVGVAHDDGVPFGVELAVAEPSPVAT